MEKIGLFPLNVVIFPNAALPLHIFEPRYKQLVSLSLSKQQTFGINLVDSSRLYQTGCTVEVTEVTQQYPDGRMDIVVTGKSRYTLHSLREGEEIYYLGDVEFFDDDADEDISDTLQRDCVVLYNEIVEIAFSSTSSIDDGFVPKEIWLDPLSFFIAQKAGLDALRKQELLEMRSETQRLQMLQKHMEELLPNLREKQRIREVIASDGYLPRNTGKH
jgi:uncharacterized protein